MFSILTRRHSEELHLLIFLFPLSLTLVPLFVYKQERECESDKGVCAALLLPHAQTSKRQEGCSDMPFTVSVYHRHRFQTSN
jgi:hypothetical protein